MKFSSRFLRHPLFIFLFSLPFLGGCKGDSSSCLTPNFCQQDLAGRARAAFLGLGTLDGDASSQAFGISSDGRVVVGASFDAQGTPHAFRWDIDAGMLGIGTPPDNVGSFASATNADGSVVAGSGTFFDVLTAFRWTKETGIVLLTPKNSTGFSANTVSGVSGDGSVIVGGGGGGFQPNAYRWTAATGAQSLGTLGGTSSSADGGVSADGNVISGGSTTASGAVAPFRWTSAGMTELPVLPSCVGGEAFGVSGDGRVTVGGCVFGDQSYLATSWNSQGVTALGKLPNQPVNFARAVSGDGSVITGHSSDCAKGCPNVAFLWDAKNGMRLLQDVLIGAGLGKDLQGWTLREAFGVSADGHVIVGFGVNPDGNDEAYIAILP
ncbi:MAG: PEP-CTERM sorting domain-containing protein [bacterium]